MKLTQAISVKVATYTWCGPNLGVDGGIAADIEESRRLSEEEEEADEMLELANAVVGSGRDSSNPSNGLHRKQTGAFLFTSDPFK